MVAPELPYIPALIRPYLLADDRFSTLCGGRLGTKAPADATRPYAKLDAPTGPPIDVSAGAWRPLVQVGGWCSPRGAPDPEVAAWAIAARAASVLDGARNVPITLDGVAGAWSVDYVLDGPTAMTDTSRGDSAPMYGATVRVALKLHLRSTV